MKRLRTGIVGCGKVGHTHASVLSRIEESAFSTALMPPNIIISYRCRSFCRLY